MTKKEIEKLCKEINSNFKKPFVDIKVKAVPDENGNGFSLYIGPRDI